MLDLKSVFKAESLEEALKILDEHSGSVKVIAGGTDIVIALREGKTNIEGMVDISGLDELKFVKDNGDYVEIGSGVSFTEVWNNEIIKKEFSGLAEAAHMVGSPQIRNRGTIGGNIANGSPAADTVPPLIALGAKCVIKSLNGERELEVKDIYLGKGEVDLAPNEIIYSIKIEKLGDNGGIGFSKLGLRNSLAISRLSVAVGLKVENGICTSCKIGSGSLSRVPEREEKIESLLIGKKLDESTISDIAKDFENYIRERLAGRSTMEFKSEAVKGSFKDAVNKALSQVN